MRAQPIFAVLAIAVAIAIATGSGIAAAQEASVVKPQVIPETAQVLDEGMQPGWHPLLSASANFMLGQNKNMPGTPDGFNITLGYMINGALGYLDPTKQHEWANALLLQLGYTRTPIVDVFLKNVDTIDFKSTYLYHLASVPWLGPFVAFRLNTAMLPAYDVRAEDTIVLKLEPGEDGSTLLNPDGTLVDTTRARRFRSGHKIDLTGAFAPLTLRESAGAFAIPVDKKSIKLDVRLGFGAWETFVRDGYVVEDNADTTVLELRQMQDSVQMGPELGAVGIGSIRDNVTYKLSALLMQPVYQSTDTELDGLELLNAEFEFLLGIKLWEWASLNYSFKALKQPLIVDAWQIQNSLLLSLSASFVK